jgi:hypothetical protein
MEWGKLDWFVFGFIIGWLFMPVYKILTRIVEEAKIAKREWHNTTSTSKRSGPDEHAP